MKAIKKIPGIGPVARYVRMDETRWFEFAEIEQTVLKIKKGYKWRPQRFKN